LVGLPILLPFRLNPLALAPCGIGAISSLLGVVLPSFKAFERCNGCLERCFSAVLVFFGGFAAFGDSLGVGCACSGCGITSGFTDSLNVYPLSDPDKKQGVKPHKQGSWCGSFSWK
jgi:hypothetical protein